MSLSVVPGAPLWRKLTHVYVKIVRPKCTQTLTVIIFCWSQDTFLLCAKIKYLQTDIFVFRTRSVANCRQANGATAILSRVVPTGLGRDIRDMPIACVRTNTDANKHARHIPMYRPVHSVHANKCSLCLIQIKFYSSRGTIPLGCAFSMFTGVETVKQSLNSIETNQGLFHNLNAHHHNANK